MDKGRPTSVMALFFLLLFLLLLLLSALFSSTASQGPWHTYACWQPHRMASVLLAIYKWRRCSKTLLFTHIHTRRMLTLLSPRLRKTCITLFKNTLDLVNRRNKHGCIYFSRSEECARSCISVKQHGPICTCFVAILSFQIITVCMNHDSLVKTRMYLKKKEKKREKIKHCCRITPCAGFYNCQGGIHERCMFNIDW